jgi:hypothetical protein
MTSSSHAVLYCNTIHVIDPSPSHDTPLPLLKGRIVINNDQLVANTAAITRIQVSFALWGYEMRDVQPDGFPDRVEEK